MYFKLKWWQSFLDIKLICLKFLSINLNFIFWHYFLLLTFKNLFIHKIKLNLNTSTNPSFTIKISLALSYSLYKYFETGYFSSTNAKQNFIIESFAILGNTY